MTPARYFKLRANRSDRRVAWLNRHTVYQGKLISMTGRIVRLFAPNPAEHQQYVDLSYDWVIPVR
jgi:S-adenosylmethionine:diacylglycerol 3-amino-3-carboxypropyl transferase